MKLEADTRSLIVSVDRIPRLTLPSPYKRVQRYRIIRNGVLLFLICYYVVGLLSGITPKREIFPFFSWFLFALTPNQQAEYGLRLTTYAGEKLDPPIDFRAAGDRIVRGTDIAFYRAVQKFGRAYANGDEAGLKRWRSHLESNHMRMPCHYELIHSSYHPIERWKTGAIRVQVIDAFYFAGMP